MTLYIDPEYLSDQVRWLSTTRLQVHHLRSTLEERLALRTLQLATSAMHELTPTLVSLAQAQDDARSDFATASLAAEAFDAVGRVVKSQDIVPILCLETFSSSLQLVSYCAE